MTDLIREISQTLGNNKLRTALTGIAVTWGIFMLIVLLSLARGVTNSFNHDRGEGNSAMLKLWSGITSKPYKGNREGRRIRMKDSDLRRVTEKNPHFVEEAYSSVNLQGPVSSAKAQVNQSCTGVFPNEFATSDRGKIVSGRFISSRDMENAAKTIVLSDYCAKQLFPENWKDAVGKRVNYKGLSFMVIGVYESRWNQQLYIPYTTARNLSTDSEDIGNLTLSLKNVNSEEDADAAEKDVRNFLARSHDFDPDDDNAVYIVNYFKNELKGRMALDILDTSMWVLGILTLLTGIIGISNIMFVTVRERTHEIGIRRAIGARPRQILTQVISESVSITVVFGYIGIVLGTVVTQIIAALIGDDGPLRNPTVSLAIALEVTLVLVISGSLAGLFPALKALKVKPVEALRDE